jgi:NADH:ubiquinone oxidoreductase subunit C
MTSSGPVHATKHSGKPSFPSWMRNLGKVYKEQGSAIFIEAPVRNFEKTMETIRSRGIVCVNAITGCDSGKDMELLYHFIHAGLVLTVKFRIPRDASMPTLINTFPSALLFEQEAHEMLGVDFLGNTNLKRVLLSETSPKTPLRKPDDPGAVKPAEEKEARHD